MLCAREAASVSLGFGCLQGLRGGGAHVRLGRLKLEQNMTQSRNASCRMTSCCTRGVAVAVSAITGTAGKHFLNTLRPL